MPAAAKLRLRPRELAAVLLWVVAGLFAEAWLTIALEPRLGDREHATNVARLVVLPLVFVGAWLVVRNRPRILKRLFAPRHFGLRLLVPAVLIGVLIRASWWAQATARVAFGVGVEPSTHADGYFSLGYACPSAAVVGVAALTWLFLVPLTEEFVHRGILLTTFANRGPLAAIGLSASLFALVHPLENVVFVFLVGLVLGAQYWRTGSLLPPVVTHATYDGLQILDWLCLRIVWWPPADGLPLWRTGLAASAIGLAAVVSVIALVGRTGQRRAASPPGP